MLEVYTNNMKTSSHPQYQQITITCNSCNTSFKTNSTLSEDFHLDVCNNCHPFFTGTQKIVDVANKARDFANRQEAAKKLQAKMASTKASKEERLGKNINNQDAPTSLKDMLKILKQTN